MPCIVSWAMAFPPTTANAATDSKVRGACPVTDGEMSAQRVLSCLPRLLLTLWRLLPSLR
jgi:hypothetical protein